MSRLLLLMVFVTVLLGLWPIRSFSAEEGALTGNELLVRLEEGQKELRERFVRLEEGQKALREQMERDLNALREQMGRDREALTQRVSDLRDLIYVVLGGMIALVGFVLWDRRSTLSPVLTKTRELEEREEMTLRALREYARREPGMAEVLKSLGLF